MSFIEFLKEVSAPAWGLAGAIVGVIGTLGATVFTNRSNNQRFEKQLAYESEQRSKDRAAELRRNVYLKAAEEIIGINTFFGQLAVADPTDRVGLTSQMEKFLKATARVSLVASERTRKHVSELSSAYGKLFIELLADASSAHRMKIDLNINRQTYETYSAERTRIISAIRETNEDASSSYKFEALSRSFENTVKPLEEVSAEYVLLSKQYNRALVHFGVMATDKLAKTSDLHAIVSGLLRSEFDLDVDIEGMKAEFRGQHKQAQEVAQEFFAKLETLQS